MRAAGGIRGKVMVRTVRPFRVVFITALSYAASLLLLPPMTANRVRFKRAVILYRNRKGEKGGGGRRDREKGGGGHGVLGMQSWTSILSIGLQLKDKDPASASRSSGRQPRNST